MFQFVKDNKPQGTISGSFRPLGDQTQFRSIFGIVDGPTDKGYTGQQIESGEIFSADGKAKIGGAAFKDAKGAYHDVKVGGTTFREYLIPEKSVAAWNKYEALQGDQMQGRFQADQQSKPERAGVAEIVENLEVIDDAPIVHAQASGALTASVPAPKSRKWTPEQKAAASAAAKARNLAKQAA